MSKSIVLKSKPAPVAPSPLLRQLTNTVAAERHGEGYRVATHAISIISDGGGAGAQAFGLDLSAAPIPSKRYAADVCDVSIRRNELSILFGQDSVFGEGLDSVLQVRMSPNSALDFVRNTERMDKGSLDETIRLVGVALEPLTPLTANPAKEAKVVVNFASIAVSGFDACVDFYHASAFSFRRLANDGEFFVEPIVRIDLRTALLGSLVNKVRELSPELNQILGVKA